MALLSVLLLLVTCLQHVQPALSQATTYVIKPATDAPCHHGDCHILAEVVNHPNRFIGSNTTLEFLNGTHYLDTVFYLANVESLRLLGRPVAVSNNNHTTDSSTIVCSGASGLMLVRISRVEIQNLRFQSCGSEQQLSTLPLDSNLTLLLNKTSQILPSISVLFLESVHLSNCRMESNYLPLFSYNSSVISHCSVFERNKGRYGGAVLAHKSIMEFVKENWFLANEATYGGGIYADNSDVTIRATASFAHNHASVYGGGIAAVNSTFTFTTSEVNTAARRDLHHNESISFLRNSASHTAGGIFLKHCTVHHDAGELNITGNAAYCDGGGLRCEESSLVLGGRIIIKSNWVMFMYGGAVYAQQSNLTVEVVNAERNTAESGGAVYLLNSKLNCTQHAVFTQNSAQSQLSSRFMTTIYGHSLPRPRPDRRYVHKSGGAIYGRHSIIAFSGRSHFSDNTAEDHGGAIDIAHTSATFTGNTTFQHGTSFSSGGGIYSAFDTLQFTGHTVFLNNSAWGSGGGLDGYKSEVHFEDSIGFIINSAGGMGGGINMLDGLLLFTGDSCCHFEGNKAWKRGGGIHLENGTMKLRGNAHLANNFAGVSGGAISVETNIQVTIWGEGKFIGNTAPFGGAVSVEEGSCRLEGKLDFINNSGVHGGAIFSEGTSLVLDGTHTFQDNVVYNGYGGGIRAVRSKIILQGTHSFVNNSAQYGGGLAVSQYARPELLLYLEKNTYVLFQRNFAKKHGGALFVEESSYIYCVLDSDKPSALKKVCFFQIKHITCPHNLPPPYGGNALSFYSAVEKHNAYFSFDGNIAEEGGDILYGGSLERCGICYDEFRNRQSGALAFKTLAKLPLGISPGSKMISSDPFQVCLCESNTPVCVNYNLTVFPGETLSIPVVAVGQLQGAVAAVIHAMSNSQEMSLANSLQYTQVTNASCTFLEYTFLSGGSQSHSGEIKLDLFAEGPCSISGHLLTFFVTFLACPHGFTLSQGACGCDSRLQRYTNSCDINDKSVTHSQDFWVGLDDASHGLVLHAHCPFDYCKAGQVSFTFDTLDLQCSRGRSGILCGACTSGLSLKLGSSQCAKCSNTFLFLLIMFAIAGFLVVVFLFIFEVTVAAGTISGLILYANIVTANRTVFFPPGETNFLTVFMAWLNLDLGIETCFFDGMDAYTRTWLQFVFPLYIWSLVGLIALASHYSMTVARIIGPTNPVAVLATLFLLSYAKLLRAIIATFSFTTLDYPLNQKEAVWVYDGNIGFLQGKHIALFIGGLLALLLLFLPYTLLLLFGQCIMAGSNHRLLSWANNHKLKSLLDAYHAPLKDRHRYWVGLLLLLRFLLLVISAVVDINSPRDPSVNLLVIATVCIGLSVWIWNTGSMYKRWYNNVLESSFILNLAILAAASYQVRVEGGSKQAVVYTSVSVAFVTFLGIMMYHLARKATNSRVWRVSIQPKLQKMKLTSAPRCANEEPTETILLSLAPTRHVTTTVVDLREPLLDSQH